jgi:hypothetical protein
LVALANFMRLSLTKAAHVVATRAAWQEIRGSAVERSAVSSRGCRFVCLAFFAAEAFHKNGRS